ncbi:MAG: transcription elongation factor GreB [Candidatus Accumulibacter sp.]|jgi:transcription elongation factor GreB|nr:transcription elongation factor GreB [Accumulibacter sp.]
MNKAFTHETDGDDEESVEPGFLQLPQGTRNYITPGGYDRIRREVDFLLKTERPRTVDVVQWAASNGDRSENGDYLYGKKRLREIDRRIRFLTKRIDIAEVVDPANRRENSDQVFFGATVIVGEEDGRESRYQIVGVDETDPARNRISWVSPLAKALIKAREGDVVRFRSPAGWREIEVLAVEYIPIDP